MTHPARIAVALGDPNGIGPEIALKAVAAYAWRTDIALTLFGSSQVIERTARALGMDSMLTGLQVIATPDLPTHAYQPGHINAHAGLSAVQAATEAIKATRRGEYDAVVAAPHHETAIHQAGIRFSGYPSLVAQVSGVREDSVFLMLVGGGLRIVHVTLHESLQAALARLTPELVEHAVHAGVRALHLLGVATPRIGLFGINPHAGEGGLFGHEDEAITQVAAQRLRSQGLHVDGPAGGDALLAQRSHDLYVAIVHDQGHIPIKLISPHRSSALSIGADVILSSVGHGCAMDIAGQGLAKADAMIDTIAMLAAIPTPVPLLNLQNP